MHRHCVPLEFGPHKVTSCLSWDTAAMLARAQLMFVARVGEWSAAIELILVWVF